MIRQSIKAALATAALMAISPLLAKDDYVYGPPPDWEAYKALATPAVLAKMPDPEHWAVEWPNGYYRYEWRHKGRFYGYLSCGVLRATGPVQDKRRRILFVVVIDHGAVQTVDISQRYSNSLVNMGCNSMIEQGLIPPAPVAAASLDHVVPLLGFTIREMPEGGYVTRVDVEAAKRLGLTTGVVITAVNGVSLAGMGGVMVKVLAAAPDGATLTLADGRTIKLVRGQ